MNFLKTFLASILGTVIGISFLFLILFIVIVSSSGEPEPYIRSNTVLTIQLSGNIPARTEYDPFRELFPSESGDRVSLERLKNNLEKAAADDRISGVWIKTNRVTGSWANLETAYKYLEKFKEESGKFVYASTDDLGMNESAYFLASIADSVFSPPETFFEFNGFVIQTSYFKNMLEKIGIEPEIIRVGSYKSAVEPFLREDSSPENREQLTSILNSVSGTFITAVEKRGLSKERINELMNEIPENSVEWALKTGLIDVIAHPHEVESAVKKRLELEGDETLRTVSLNRYNRVQPRSAGLEVSRTDNQIAVIYASGMIIPKAMSGGPFSTDPTITAEGIQESLKSSLDNDNVQAIVIHINSGGGAISTSELIVEHIREASRKKPVIAYLGNVAASGGYYIAMGADTVVASPNTITGSIGIYNMMFNTQELYNDKLGINFEEFKTHDHADINLMTRPLTQSEREAIQRSVENGYETFLNRVAAGRSMTRDEVHEIGQGRVWTGTEAFDLNLVDLLGSLDDAIAVAANKADIEEYRLITYPERKELFDMLFSSTEAGVSSWVRSLIPYSKEIQTVEQLMQHNAGRNWAIMPVQFTID